MTLLARLSGLGRPLRVRAFRSLWLAQLVSELGDWAARLALSVLVYERTNSPALTGVAVATSLLAWLGPGQLLTTLSERWPRRRVLVLSDLVRAVAFALVALPVPLPVLLVVVFLAGLATPPFEAARSALRPEIVPAPLFGSAVALSSITEDLTVALGYLAGGALVAALGAEATLLCNAATFALSALLLIRLPDGEAARAPGKRGGLLEARRELSADPAIVRAIALVTAAMLAGTGLTAISAPLVLDVLDAGPATLGLLVALTSAVSILVTALLPVERPSGVLLRYAAALTLVGGAGVILGFALVPWARVQTLGAALAFATAGLLFVVIAPANIVVGPRLRPETRASAFSLLMGFLIATEAAGAAGAGLAAAAFGLLPVGLVLGVPALLTGLWALRGPVLIEISAGSDAGTPLDKGGVGETRGGSSLDSPVREKTVR